MGHACTLPGETQARNMTACYSDICGGVLCRLILAGVQV